MSDYPSVTDLHVQASQDKRDAVHRVFTEACWKAFCDAWRTARGCPHLQCAFCGELLVDHEHVRAHAMTCQKHPMREVEEKLAAAMAKLDKAKKVRNLKRRR